MCGIVAYTGRRACKNILLRGLQKLEYRGYDSAGVAWLDNQLQVYKQKGKVQKLFSLLQGLPCDSHIGIGHTRWATHGAPNQVNAHPQVSATGKLAMVHNGIIENYHALRQELKSKGYTFQSSTDTEILLHFIENIQQEQDCPLEEAVQIALTQAEGAYAIVILSVDLPHTLIAAKKGSPLVIGIGQNESFVASDAMPIVEYTRQVTFLPDYSMAVVQRGKLSLQDLHNTPITPYIQELDLAFANAEKGQFGHFMLKEIFEQPQAVRNCMRGRLQPESSTIVLGGIREHIHHLVQAKRIIIIACGTSWHAGLVAEYFIENTSHIPLEVEYASEFRYRNPILQENDVVIAISQSGETADTLAAIRLARQKKVLVLSICNVVESTVTRETHAGLYTHAGPEVGVASTKAFTTQVTVLMLIALKIAQKKKNISTQELSELLQSLSNTSKKIEQVLQQNDAIQRIAQVYQNATNFLFLGRGNNFPIALEGALKLKEISYIHAEGYPAAEMKHGPIALIDASMPVVVIATQDALYEKIIANMEEIRARKGKIIAIVTEGDQVATKLANHSIVIPAVHTTLTPLLSVVPLQLLAYHIAVARGCNVDRPRNLAKSVTVE